MKKSWQRSRVTSRSPECLCNVSRSKVGEAELNVVTFVEMPTADSDKQTIDHIMSDEKSTPKTLPSPAKTEERSSTPRDLVQSFLLLVVLAGSSYVSQAIQRPIFGATLASSWYRVGSFVSVVIGSLACPDTLTTRTNVLRFIAVLLVAGSAVAKPLAAWAATNIDNPASAPLAVHAVLGFPVLGLGGAVWLQYMVCCSIVCVDS